MLTHKPKTIQIDFDLFEDLYVYSARHTEPDDLQYKRITAAVKKKLEELMKHELYSLYKSGASEEIRKKARDEYLDAAGIMDSFRWSTEQDMNITHGEGGAQLMSKQHTNPWETEYKDFNYDNVDPETLKEWEAEFRRKDQCDMQKYLKQQFPDATPEEKKALRRWVRSGRSPFENGWYVVTESGGPMDFISAMRFLEEEYQEYLKDPEGYRGYTDEQPENVNPPSGASADDLPF